MNNQRLSSTSYVSATSLRFFSLFEKEELDGNLLNERYPAFGKLLI